MSCPSVKVKKKKRIGKILYDVVSNFKELTLRVSDIVNFNKNQ